MQVIGSWFVISTCYALEAKQWGVVGIYKHVYFFEVHRTWQISSFVRQVQEDAKCTSITPSQTSRGGEHICLLILLLGKA